MKTAGNGTVKKILVMTFIVVILCTAFGCGPKQVEVTKLVIGKDTIAFYFPNLDIKSAQYEQFANAYRILGRDMSLAPSDLGYRGFIKLTDEAAAEIRKQYEWQPDNAPLPSMTEIDTTSRQKETWYSSFDFISENASPSAYTNDLRFNGQDTIVFDIQSH